MSLPPPPPSGGPIPPPPPSKTALPATGATCYRHSDRPTGRNCTRCGRPACAECLHSASVGSHCSECLKSGPKPAVKSRVLMRTDGLPVTYGLMAICLALFVVSIVQDPRGAISGAATPLHQELDLYEPFVAVGQYYRLFTSGFMHFGIIHIGFNMFILFQLGRLLEPVIGSIRFGLLYFASLLGGSLGVVLLSNNVLAAGASGAVFGLMGAAAIGQWLRGVNPFSTSLGRLIALNLILTFAIPNIAIGAHVGGLIIGALCGWFLMSPNPRRYPAWIQFGLPTMVGVACFAASIVFAV